VKYRPPIASPSPGRPVALLPLIAALALAGCTTIENFLSGDRIDYRSSSRMQSKGLEVPPDLTQLARENRYQLPGGVVSASTSGAVVAGSPTPLVAPNELNRMRVERQGSQRWLVVPLAPERLFPQVRSFWQENGFTLSIDSAEAGVIETGWAENRAKLPQDLVRQTLGKVFENLYDTGERDRFRTRIERTESGSEIFISHRGLQEVFSNERKDQTIWQPRPSDPQLEAEFLTRLMVRLGTPAEQARAIVANAPDSPPKARLMAAAAGSVVEVDEPFDRTWRRVGLALDRSGFTVEDRDRSAGLYFVRYVDPKDVDKEEPNFFTRLFRSGASPGGPVRYRVVVKAEGTRTNVSVLSSAGAPDSGENARRIAAQLVADLK
jgi:outer membrane protein assembly factor BamC